MKKLLVSIVLVFTLSATTSSFVANPTVSVVEAKEKKKKAYTMTWKGFKKRWKREAKAFDLKSIAKIKNEAIDETNMGPTKIGKIKENLYVGLNTNRDADGDFGFISVSGRIVNDDSKESSKNNLDVRSAGSLAIFIADPNLSQKKRASIIYDKLKINDAFEDGEERTYSYKGITYKAKYEYKRSNYGTFTVKVIEE